VFNHASILDVVSTDRLREDSTASPVPRRMLMAPDRGDWRIVQGVNRASDI